MCKPIEGWEDHFEAIRAKAERSKKVSIAFDQAGQCIYLVDVCMNALDESDDIESVTHVLEKFLKPHLFKIREALITL
jgi:hypothetical protein